jgi:4-carboxymuconolactone decarboxylase
MKQDIRMAAILERDGRVFLVRHRVDAPWELPGGPLPLENDDIDAEMDAKLTRMGVMAPAIEEDFLQTHYFPAADGQVVYNVYAATDWAGDPAMGPGTGSGWFSLSEVEAIGLHDWTKKAVLEAFGLVEPEDDTEQILNALRNEGPRPPVPSPDATKEGEFQGRRGTGSDARRTAGLDVLRTLRGGGDPVSAAEAMERAQPEIAGDVIDFALGEVWSDAALDRKSRSLQVVAMLAAMGRTGGPLTSHINGALNHGATPDQVVQTLRMVAVYAGFPAALEAWPVMEKVFEQRGIARPGRLTP